MKLRCYFPALDIQVLRLPNNYPHSPTSLGKQILKRRLDLKILQKQVAEIIGVTEDCITNWENEITSPQIQYYPRIIRFLEYSPFIVNMSTLGGRIKQFRFENGMSQKKMGKLLGVDGTTICSWEENENLPVKKSRVQLEKLGIK